MSKRKVKTKTTNKMISDSQQSYFEEVEPSLAARYVEVYSRYLDKLAQNSTEGELLNIVDIGGAQGLFALSIKEYFNNRDVASNVSVIDYRRYDVWAENGEIRYIEESAFTALEKFPDGSIDAVFLNLVLHHLVSGTYRKSRQSQRKLLEIVRKKLKSTGYVFICETSTQNPLFGELSIPVAYYLTKNRVSFIVKLLKKLGSKSAGTGILFLSPMKWDKILAETNYVVEQFHEEPWLWMKKPLLHNKFYWYILKKEQ